MFSKGQLFTNSSGGTFRVLAIDVRDPSVVHVIGMDEAKSLPQQWKLSALKEGFRSTEFKRLVTSSAALAISRPRTVEGEAPHKTAAEKAADRRMELIGPLVCHPDIYWRTRRGKLVTARALETQASEQTIMTCLRLYWRGGMTRDALLANFANCGTSTHAATSLTVAGRTPSRREYPKFRMTEEDKANVRKTGLRLFMRKKTATRQAIYKAIVAKYFSYTDANGIVMVRPLGERPTPAQVDYELKKHISLEIRLRRNHGDDNFENDFQPKTGSQRIYAYCVGRYFEIDSTIVDVWIVAQSDRNTVIGKATLYLIIDGFSNLIVGFHLSLDKPSWCGAMEAMLTVVEDKQALCDRWGFDHQPADWPAHGVWPMFWVADRGSDFLCHASDNAVEGIEGGFINVPRRKAPRKGRVECGFKLIQVPLKDHVGGYTPPAEIGKRQTDDRKGNATRTLRELGCEILHSIRKHNHRIHKGIKLPPGEVYAKLQPIPVDIWQRDYEERAGMLSSFDEDFVRFKLLPKAEASVTRRGILFNGLLYKPRGHAGNELLLRAVRGIFKTAITHERRLVDCIYVHDPKNPSNWITADLIGTSTAFAGYSAAEVASVEDLRLTLEDLADESNLAIDVRHHLEAEKREKAAKAETLKDIRKAAGRSRTNGAQEARATLIRNDHAKTKVMASTAEPTTANPVVSAPTPASSGKARVAPMQVSPTQVTPTPRSPEGPSPTPAPTAPTAANASLLALLKLKKKS